MTFDFHASDITIQVMSTQDVKITIESPLIGGIEETIQCNSIDQLLTLIKDHITHDTN